MDLYGSLAVLAALFNVSIGASIVKEDPHSKTTRRFLFATLLLAFWGGAEVLARFAPDERTSLLWVKTSYVPFFTIPIAFYLLAHRMSQEKWKIPLYASVLFSVFCMVLLFTDSFIKGVSFTTYGYEPVYGGTFPYFVAVYTAVMLIGFLLLLLEKMKLKESGKLPHLNVILHGFGISLFFASFFELIPPLFGWELPRIGSTFSVFAVLACRYSYLQYTSLIYPKLQIPTSTKDAPCGSLCSLCSSFQEGRCKSCAMADLEKKKECPIYVCTQKKNATCPTCKNILSCIIYAGKDKCPIKDSSKYIPAGVSYQLESPTYSPARAIFRDRIIRGDFGLVVSREHPDVFFEKWDLERVPLLWLSVEEEDKWTVNPTNLAKLAHIVSNFIKEVPFSCVLFEGFEYLIVHNSFGMVMKSVYSINDEVVRNKCRFILSYDARAFDRNSLAVIEKEFKHLPEEYILE